MRNFAYCAVGLVLLLAAASSLSADDNETRKIIRRAKAATALVQTERKTSATAFCIEPAGWFITNRHVFGQEKEGTETTLVLNPGEDNERALKAKVLRINQEADLALLQAEGEDFEFLPLGSDEELYETMRVTAFGYPFGRLLADKGDYPSVTVTAGRITALRRRDGLLESIQLDNSLNPGNSGGPVIDTRGHVVGVVRWGIRGSGVNFAIPVTDLKRFIQRPLIQFDPPEVDEASSREEQTFFIEVSSLKAPPADRQVELEIQAGEDKPRRFEARGKNGSYQVKVVLVPTQPTPDMLQVDAEFAAGSLCGRIADLQVKVGSQTMRLSNIRRVEPAGEGEPPKVILDGKVLRGKINGLNKAKIDLGKLVTRVDLSKAVRMTLSPVEESSPRLTYRVIVRDGDAIVGEKAGEIALRPSPQTAHAGSSSEEIKITPPQLGDDRQVVKLPGPIDQVVVGAGGKLLIMHIKKLQQLAIFDVSRAEVVKYLPLVSNDISYTAGANKLFIGLRENRTIQRWDLTTFEREQTVDAPDGGIGTLAMGAESTTPLILLASQSAKKSYVIDTASMKAQPHHWQGWKGGAWGPVHVHVSFDGSTAVVCGGGWAGIEVASIVGGKITSSKKGSYVHGDTLVAGNGALVFPTKGGIVRRDLASNTKGIEGTPFPAVGPAFSLAFATNDGKPFLHLFGNNDPRRIATIRDLPELAVNSSLPIHQRVLLISRAHVLITVGEGNDRLYLRSFDLEKVLGEEEIDYLFVESAPLVHAERGKTYEYPIQVRSRKGGVTFSLQAGPEGMKITDEGVLTWKTPSKYEGRESPIIVKISDASGQELFHSFRLSIVD